MTYNNLPTVSTSTQPMSSGCASKYYTFYTASFDVPAASVNSAKYDVTASSTSGEAVSDSFKSLPGLSPSAAPLVCSATAGKRSVKWTA